MARLEETRALLAPDKRHDGSDASTGAAGDADATSEQPPITLTLSEAFTVRGKAWARARALCSRVVAWHCACVQASHSRHVEQALMAPSDRVPPLTRLLH